MRDIKFRAWDTETKEMSYDFLNKHWLRVCIESPFVELMQYTGLKDKNGRKIYEGDIIRDEIGCGEVEWVQEHCGFKVFTRNPSFYWNFESDGETKNTEVIGNIYENHELLEEEQ